MGGGERRVCVWGGRGEGEGLLCFWRFLISFICFFVYLFFWCGEWKRRKGVRCFIIRVSVSGDGCLRGVFFFLLCAVSFILLFGVFFFVWCGVRVFHVVRFFKLFGVFLLFGFLVLFVFVFRCVLLCSSSLVVCFLRFLFLFRFFCFLL